MVETIPKTPRKKSPRLEAKFTAEMGASFKHFNCAFYHRIPDDPFSPGTKFTHKKPFDAMAFGVKADKNLIAFALEYKTVNGEISQRWPLTQLKAHQVENLELAEKQGATSLVIINYRNMIKPKTFTFILPLCAYHEAVAKGLKSLSLFDFSSICQNLPRLKLGERGYGWDVRQLFL